MANRTVSVGLELHAEQYKTEADVVKEKTREVKDEVKNTDQEINKIPPDAAKAAAAMRLLGAEGENASLRLRDLGQSSTALQEIESRLKIAQEETRRLADEFNRTGNGSTLHALFESQSTEKDLENLKNRVSKALDDGGKDGAQKLGQDVGQAGAALSVPLAAYIAGAVVLALPAINGALLSTAGLGGIALGIAGQLRDERVRSALADVGHTLLDELSRDTTAFTQPLIQSARTFGGELGSALHGIDFASLAQAVEPLVLGLGGLVSTTMPGFNEMLREAKPILDALAAELPMLGRAVSDMFSMFAQGGEGAKRGLRELILVLAGLLEVLGAVVLVFSKLTEWGTSFTDTLLHIATNLSKIAASPAFFVFEKLAGLADNITTGAGALDQFGISLVGVRDTTQDLTPDLNKLAASIGSVTTTSTVAAKTAGFLFDTMMGLDEASLSLHRSQTTLHDTLAKNSKTLDENTVAGQQNAAALLDAVRANMQLYQANVAAGMTAADAAVQYDKGYDAIHRQATGAGLGSAAVDGLIGKYRSVPDSAAGATGSISDMTDAINRLISQIRTLLGLPNSKEFSLRVTEEVHAIGTGAEVRSAIPNARGGVYTHAAAGVLRQAEVFSPAAPARYAFAEPATGGEAFVPMIGDYNRSTGIIDQAARWYGGRFVAGGGGTTVIVRQPVNLVTPVGDVFHRTLIEYALNTGRTPADLFPASHR